MREATNAEYCNFFEAMLPVLYRLREFDTASGETLQCTTEHIRVYLTRYVNDAMRLEIRSSDSYTLLCTVTAIYKFRADKPSSFRTVNTGARIANCAVTRQDTIEVTHVRGYNDEDTYEFAYPVPAEEYFQLSTLYVMPERDVINRICTAGKSVLEQFPDIGSIAVQRYSDGQFSETPLENMVQYIDDAVSELIELERQRRVNA